jgi:hypothetical protein
MPVFLKHLLAPTIGLITLEQEDKSAALNYKIVNALNAAKCPQATSTSRLRSRPIALGGARIQHWNPDLF